MKKANQLVFALVLLSIFTSSFVQGEGFTREDIVYVSRDGVDVSYDVISPEHANGAAVLLMSSGGWFSQKRPVEMVTQGFGFLLDAGYTLIPIRHRSAPTFKVPDAVADVQYAVRHVRHHAEDYGINDELFATMGFSSGGHLTLMIALDSDAGETSSDDAIAQTANHIAAAIAYFPPVDLEGIVGPSDRFPALEFDPALTQDVSPINFVDANDPPVLLLHGTEDQLVTLSHSSRMHAALADAGVASTLSVFEGAGHGFRSEEHQARAQAEILEFLGTYLVAE